MMWGSILALWGTAAIVATSSRGLGIKKVISKDFWACLLHILIASVKAVIPGLPMRTYWIY